VYKGWLSEIVASVCYFILFFLFYIFKIKILTNN
jgi:hypothetical protein